MVPLSPQIDIYIVHHSLKRPTETFLPGRSLDTSSADHEIDLTDYLFLSAADHPKVVWERLGHATSQTTDTHSHLLPDVQSEAVNAMEAALC